MVMIYWNCSYWLVMTRCDYVMRVECHGRHFHIRNLYCSDITKMFRGTCVQWRWNHISCTWHSVHRITIWGIEPRKSFLLYCNICAENVHASWWLELCLCDIGFHTPTLPTLTTNPPPHLLLSHFHPPPTFTLWSWSMQEILIRLSSILSDAKDICSKINWIIIWN